MSAPDLAAFLLARLAEDEAVARDAAGWGKDGQVRANGRWSRTGLASLEDDDRRSVIYSDANQLTGQVADHIARHDPARVLADVEAKRRIMQAHPLTTNVVPVWTGSTPGYACDNCARLSKIIEDSIVEDIGACDTLCALASVYADHPDYRGDEWAP